MRRLQLLLLLAGVALFAVLLHRVGLEEIGRGFGVIGWALLPALLVEFWIHGLHAEGWRPCLGESRRAVRRLDLFLVRNAGYATNLLIPSGTMGGELVKALLLRRWTPPIDAYASVIVEKLSFAVGQSVFLLFGLSAVFGDTPFTPSQRLYAGVALLLWFSGVGTFFLLLRGGALGTGVRALEKVLGLSTVAARLPGRVQQLDERVVSFFHARRRALVLSVGTHVLSHAFRTLQFLVLLRALGFEPTAASCFTMAAGLVFMEATLFLIPARLGVQEGGHIVVFTALGYDAATAIIVSFAMRLCELGVALTGLGAFGYYHFSPTEAVPRETVDLGAEDR